MKGTEETKPPMKKEREKILQNRLRSENKYSIGNIISNIVITVGASWVPQGEHCVKCAVCLEVIQNNTGSKL